MEGCAAEARSRAAQGRRRAAEALTAMLRSIGGALDDEDRDAVVMAGVRALLAAEPRRAARCAEALLSLPRSKARQSAATRLQFLCCRSAWPAAAATCMHLV